MLRAGKFREGTLGRAISILALLLMFSAVPSPISTGVMAASERDAESAGQSSDNPSKNTSESTSEKAAANSSPKPSSAATLKRVSAASPDARLPDYDVDAEQQLLDLANQSRTGAGEMPLTLDPGLTEAARRHAEAMLAAQQLSHQFLNEPSLSQRLAAATDAPFDQAGENVALDFDAAQGHEHLMHSPPHRANLLNAAYNAVGVGVIRNGTRLYIVQDFAHALPNYSVTQVKERIAAALAQGRQRANQPEFAHRDLANADEAACSMAQAEKLGTSPIHQLAQRYTVLTYTSLHPEDLPEAAGQALTSRNLRGYSVGACYAKTASYPSGAYWVVVALE